MILRIPCTDSTLAALKRIAKARRLPTTAEALAQEVIEQYVIENAALNARIADARRAVDRSLGTVTVYADASACEIHAGGAGG